VDVNVDFLPDREAVLERATALTQGTQREWIGMGRTAAWIKLPSFAQAVAAARESGATFKVVVFFEGDAAKHSRTWEDHDAEVRYFEHGYVRLLIFDSSDAIIAFPKVVTSLYEDREYFGYHVRDARSVSELRNYFKQIWEQADSLTDACEPAAKEKLDAGRILFAAGVLRFIVRVIQRAFPTWFGQ